MGIIDIKPDFSSIETATGSLVGTVAYNSSFAYNSTQPYGGFSGGQGAKPLNRDILNTKPNQ